MTRLNLALVTATTTVFAAVAYLACAAFQPLLPNLAMYTSPMWAAAFPGFSWSLGGVLIGLVEIMLYAAAGSALYVGLYNAFAARMTPAGT